MPVDVPHHHQKNGYFCGPTCLKMVMEYFGVKKTEKEIALIADTNEEKGTSHRGMIEACRKMGFSCFVHENSSLEDVTSFLRANLPVIVDWVDDKSETGHYTVVSDMKNESMIFCDPWYGPDYPVEKATFEGRWRDSMTNGERWIMVVLADVSKMEELITNPALIAAGKIYRPE